MSWQKVKLKTLLTQPVQNGYSPVCPDKPNGKWVLGLGALTNHGLDIAQAKPAPENDKKVDEFLLRDGDFLVSRSNTRDKVGRSALFKGQLQKCSYPDLMMRFRVDESKIAPEFLEAYLRGHEAVRYFQSSASGTSGSMVKINKRVVEKLPVPLPPLPEQTAIADLLSTWDEVIEKIERLIAAKERQFSSLMFSLIRKRHKDWQHKVLSSITEIKKGEQLNRTELEKSGDYPAWNGGITPSGYTDRWNTPENTITISEGGNSCGFVNYSDRKFWCGGHCYALIGLSEEISAEYLYFYLKAHEKRIMRLRVGSGLPNIQRKDLEKFVVYYPDKPAQRQIAGILALADKEIKLLKKETAYLNTQKRGLMQKLLTGEWRVKLSREVA